MPRRSVRMPLALVVPTAVWVVGCAGAGDGSIEPPPASLACDRLADTVNLDGAAITLAEVVPAGMFTPPGTRQSIEVPAFCRVVGQAPPAVNFEVWLPESTWNGKFQGVGNGGMAGSISYTALGEAIRRGYAAASTDTGHTVTGLFDASWAAGRPDLLEDFGHRATHLTAIHGKAITTARFGQSPARAYYMGCSKGGQQGLMEAQRYPDDYDGLIAGDPAHDWVRLYAGAHLGISRALLADPDSYLPADKLQLLDDAVMSTCDAADGVADGVLDDPKSCRFDPGALTCEAGQDEATCLTPKQAQAVRDIWSGRMTSDGQTVFPGLFPGGEAAPGGWGGWVTGREPFTSLHWQAADSFFKYAVFDDPEWDFGTFDFDTDVARAQQLVGSALDATDPDLRPLRDRGAKLIVYHGSSDADISPQSSIDYYEDVVITVGSGLEPQAALADTQDFFRLFLVPGMGHCRGGRGTDQFDALTALEQWVESDIPPDRIEASRVRNGEVDRTRPLCPYPQVARWNGTGDPDDTASFSCVAD